MWRKKAHAWHYTAAMGEDDITGRVEEVRSLAADYAEMEHAQVQPRRRARQA